VAMHGLTDRCASVRSLSGGFSSISDVQEEKEAALIALATAAVEEDGAEVVVLAGAPLAGLAAKVRDQIPVPLVDQVAAAVKQAEAIGALSPRKATAGSFARTGAKPSFGLGTSLANRISRNRG
ncbi:MAG: aspartate/glutamate racemase family protein, partial [Alphaproteobacteria bacterium]